MSSVSKKERETEGIGGENGGMAVTPPPLKKGQKLAIEYMKSGGYKNFEGVANVLSVCCDRNNGCETCKLLHACLFIFDEGISDPFRNVWYNANYKKKIKNIYALIWYRMNTLMVKFCRNEERIK